MKIYRSNKTKSGTMDLLLESDDITKIQALHKQCGDEIATHQGEYSVVGNDGKKIISVWYSDRYDEPIQSRHNVTHPDYRKIWWEKT